MSPQKVAQCGTPGGYHRHRRNGEDACQPCMTANRDYQRDRKAQIAAGTWKPRARSERKPRMVAGVAVRVAYSGDEALVVAKALAHYKRLLRSTQASHVPGAILQAETAARLGDALVLSLSKTQGARS